MQLISSKRVLRQIFWLNFISFREKLSVAKNLARKVTLVSKWAHKTNRKGKITLQNKSVQFDFNMAT